MIVALLVIFVILAIVGVFVSILSYHQSFVSSTGYHVTARAMAQSGIEYALHQLRHGDWLSRPKPIEFTSPMIGGRGSFDLRVTESTGAYLVIRSVGRDRLRRAKSTATVTVTDPAAILGATLSVLNYDYDLRGLDENALTVFGSDGVAASGLIEEMHTIQPQGEITLMGATDPLFASISPGSEYIVDADGITLSKTDKVPPEPGRYTLNYASGQLGFSSADTGRRLSILYDYVRRIPTAPPYAISLPYSPIRELSDEVFGMRRTMSQPTARGCYMPNYADGTLTFSAEDAGALVNIRYSYLGTRIAGRVRVNGDLQCRNTNLLYLVGSRGDRLSASGKIDFAPESNVVVWNEEGKLARLESPDGCYVAERAPAFTVPAVSIKRLRRRSRSHRPNCLYIDNPDDVEFGKRSRPAPAADADDEEVPIPAIDWPRYLNLLYRDWTDTGGDCWKGGVYTPPGHGVDLGSVVLDADGAVSALVFAEGNVILRGGLRDRQHAVIVSARNIYIDDSIVVPRSSSLTLIADGNVCINLSRLQPRGSTAAPAYLYLNCAAFARHGALGVIPGGGATNRLVMHGSFFVNRMYPNAEWAKAFSSIDWMYDPSLLGAQRLPGDLIEIVEWQ